MTTESLSWTNVKDKLVIFLGAASFALLGIIYSRQEVANDKISKIQADIAVLIARDEWKQAELSDINQRLRTLETRGQK